ncbi:metal ABC transporter substrate-binding protein [Mariniplasma anaerobium]|uniref:Zinc ABC transporter substrate-binding protein n=1 Tax=Mariniplasma anaerobium TaxID=2735436 RepID=A0A7U9TGX1_9MOLU|nr:metal ABC transporter substrate-binding protein [Mariniplasma anaerobium]BCR36350.1 zinc ABC transporter substrate-binding protein [Mariniplasma anaerobium]
MKKFAIYVLLLLSAISLASCNSTQDKPDIVATMFTHYDFAKQIAGDKLEVALLIPLGTDIHSFEASSKDMVDINQSKLFLFTSLEIDQWIKDPTTIAGQDTIVLNMSESFTYEEHTYLSLSTQLIEDEHDHDEELHYWVDPLNALQMIDYILEHIIEIDPENEAYYVANATAYKDEIYALHLEMDSVLSYEPYKDSTIYFAGHNALSAFAERYHLNIESLFSEFKPDDDLTSSEIINFSDLVKNADTHYLFIEALTEPKAANAIKESLESNDQYQLNLLTLHTYHNLNQADWEANITYKDLMQRNFDHIKIALGITN